MVHKQSPEDGQQTKGAQLALEVTIRASTLPFGQAWLGTATKRAALLVLSILALGLSWRHGLLLGSA